MDRKFVIEDASFIVSVLNPLDTFHKDAIETLRIIDKASFETTYVLPEIALCETVFTLMKNGVNPEKIRNGINKLTMLPRVIIASAGIMTVLRYASRFLNILSLEQNQMNITKTQDYLIACSSVDYGGLLLTSDKKMEKTVICKNLPCYNFSKVSARKQLEKELLS